MDQVQRVPVKISDQNDHPFAVIFRILNQIRFNEISPADALNYAASSEPPVAVPLVYE